MAKIGAAGYFTSACSSIICGWLSDRWILAGACPTRVRKAFTGGGIGLSGVLLGISALVGPSACVIFLLLGMACFGASASNLYAITQRLAGPNAAGRWTGFQNGFGNLAGVVVPIVTGYAVTRTGNFTLALVILALVSLISTACWYFVVGPVEPVRWGRRENVSLALSAQPSVKPAQSA
jgi:nitrate/nitrite transporter NarK